MRFICLLYVNTYCTYITRRSHSAAPTIHIWNNQSCSDTQYNLSLTVCYIRTWDTHGMQYTNTYTRFNGPTPSASLIITLFCSYLACLVAPPVWTLGFIYFLNVSPVCCRTISAQVGSLWSAWLVSRSTYIEKATTERNGTERNALQAIRSRYILRHRWSYIHTSNCTCEWSFIVCH